MQTRYQPVVVGIDTDALPCVWAGIECLVKRADVLNVTTRFQDAHAQDAGALQACQLDKDSLATWIEGTPR